ncbi:MAG: hypothetical protein KGI75_26125, partial [Rhizobiaceae bacterium]|nr:hypothetical protein [Rhizobiaceae bacterium]
AVLGLASGIRHPGIAVAVTALSFPDQKAAIAVVLWHIVIAALVSLPYVKRVRKASALEASGN